MCLAISLAQSKLRFSLPNVKLRGVEKVLFSTKCDYFSGLSAYELISVLKNEMIRSRSVEEEAARIEGWRAVANLDVKTPYYWIYTIKQLKSMLVQCQIPIRGLRLKRQYVFELKKADADLEAIAEY